MSVPQPGRATTSLRLCIELSRNLEGNPRERCPIVHFIASGSSGNEEIDALPTDVEKPHIAAEDHAFSMVDARDILSRVIDEETWLAEFHRVIAPGGHLSFTVPAAGALAWLDARNIYRYVTHVLKRGDPPDDTLPTGWNRHYHENEVRHLLEVTGFELRAVERIGIGIAEIPQLAGLMVGNFLLGDRETEVKLHPLRERMETYDQTLNVPGIGTSLYVLAVRL